MSAPRLLLLIPPLTQLNTPYPSTAYLTGFLKRHGSDVTQADVGIEMVLALLSRDGLSRVFDRVRAMPGDLPGEAEQMLALEQAYLNSIDAVIWFLQGQDPTLAPRICQGGFLPQGPRFAHADEQSGAFGTLGATDRARYLATLYLEDLADLIHETVSPQFALSRYAEHVGVSAASFDAVARALAEPPSLTDEMLLDAVWGHVEGVAPTLLGLTVPFPGNLYGALRIAQAVKARRPAVRIVLGGGYVNTELRRLQEPRLFDYVDYVTLDDGERPLLCLLEHLAGKRDEAELRRTFLRSEGRVVWRDGARDPEFGMAEIGTPTYAGLALDRYLSVLDVLNPMHRLWSDGHWNKLLLEAVHLLRCRPGLHRPVRGHAERDLDRPHRGADRRDRETGVPLRGRGGATGGAQGPGVMSIGTGSGDHVVGEHPLRAGLHAGPLPPARRVWMRRRHCRT